MRDLVRVSALFLVAAATMALAYTAGFATALDRRHADADASSASVAGSTAPATQEVTAGNPGSSVWPPANFGLFWEAWREVEDRYYGELPSADDRTFGAIQGSLSSLEDPYTAFSDPTDTEVSRPDLQGEFEGIGAFVTTNEAGQLMIQSPMPGQPAERAGLLAGDVVIAVDGRDISHMDVSDAVLLIRGPKGTVVNLTVLREGEADPLEFSVERDRIEIPSVTEVQVFSEEGQPTVGYLRLTEFAQDTLGELQTALEQLRADGAEALIVDVRNNPGGYLSSAVDVTSEFLDSGVVVMQENAAGERREERVRGGGGWLDAPVVMLVNRGSASASEILAGALRDHDRAVLVGETTFGKGSVQNVHELSDRSELRVTIAAWLTPDGDHIHKKGIEPDVAVELTAEDRASDADPQLDRAVEEARRLVTGQ